MRTLLWGALCASAVARADIPSVLTLDEALRLTHEHQPSLVAAAAQINAADARTRTALSPWLPQVSMAIGYSRSTANFVARPGSVPSSISTSSSLSIQGYDFFTSSLTAQQLLWDFGQTWNRWDASKATLEAQRATAKASAVAVDLQLRTAYFAAAAQKELVEVAKATLANQNAHYTQVEGFVKAGTHPDIDLVQSRSDRATARLQVITATNAYTVAKAKLNQAMGLEDVTSYDVVDQPLSAIDLETAGLEAVVTAAASERPDYVSLDAQMRAQQFTIKAARGAYWPTLNAQGQATAQARSLDAITPNLSFGLNLNWALFQGGATMAQVAEAEATLAQLTAQRDIAHHQIRLDVEQALLDVTAAKEAVEAATDALDASREQQRLAEGRYKAGAGSIIEWGDAQVRFTTTSSQLVQARFNLASARARLLAALGR